jgi:2-keto-4-pentenoate hydratase
VIGRDAVSLAAAIGDASVVSAADRLRQAKVSGVPCAPVRGLLPADVRSGYAVQRLLTALSLESGRRIVGHKIGLTNPRVQAQLRVDQPDFGVLFDDMVVPDGGMVDTTRLLQPRIEAEVAMVLADDLDGDDLGPAAVRAAVGQVVAALEIVDSRIAGWDISIVDTVADNASSGLFVLGTGFLELGGTDLTGVRMSMREDGTEVSTGSGADCLGDPLAALSWLATTACELGRPLRRGDVVLSGALGPMVPVRPGATYTADVTGLGSVSVTFTGGNSQ